MKKVVYICDGCGKQGDERTTRKRRKYGYYSHGFETVTNPPEGWSRVVVDRKGSDICSPGCAAKAIDNITAKAVAAAEAKAAAAKAKAAKAAEKVQASAEKARKKLASV